ncbi:MAG: M15 family metallopeptidase [Ilumatobacteraceae bacterium]
MRVRTVTGLAALLVVAIGAASAAAALTESIDRPAVATRQAEPASPLAAEVVTIYNSGPLRQDVADRAVAAARASGASVAFGRAASVGMVALRRGSAPVQIPQQGFAYPMGTTVLPPDVIARTMGRDVSGLLGPNTAVMGSLTAGLRGAQAGDTMDLVSGSGAIVPITVAAVVDDDVLGGTELLIVPAAADRLGITNLSRAVLWGFPSRAAIDAAMSANGLVSTSIRIRRSWDPADPDSTMGMAQTKAALGEFAYRVNANGSVSLDDAWRSRYITTGGIGGLSLQTGCHSTVRVALQSAMDEVAARGLTGTINFVDANRAGGCFLARFNRLTPDSSLGFLSRHSWGMAVDTNTVGSCQGCAPPDFATRPGGCQTVQIFRKHGFAWGGNYLTPDGMHFEWVGEPRDQLSYPSRFCPNVVTSAPLTTEPTERATLFADDGLYVGDH